MKHRRQSTLIAVSLLALLLGGCVSQPEGVYRGGVLIEPEPLSLRYQYSIQLLDKWRLSHAWIGGPVDIRFCKHSRMNGARAEERYIEVDGWLTRFRASESSDPQDRGKVYALVLWETIYGLNTRTRKFEGYNALCTHTFQDVWTGFSVYLIKPDPANGTDAWIEGAVPVTVNELQWLRKTAPPADYSRNIKQWAASIETWTLKLPDSPYWFVMVLGGSTGGAGAAPGINRDPAKFEEVRTLFHQMVASVRLTPLPPPGPP